MAASLFELSRSVGELVQQKKKLLVDLEDMSYRYGVEPGPDLSFGGLRIAVEHAAQAQQLLAALAPHEAELKAWLEARRVPFQTDPARV